MALVLTLLCTGTTFAQADQPAYCQDLSASDCTLLMDSQDAMSTVTSGASQMDLSILLRDIPEAPFQEIALDYSQDTVFSVDPAVFDAIDKLKAMPPRQLQQLVSNPQSLFGLIGELVAGVSTDIAMTLDLSSELAAVLSQESGMPLPENMAFHMVLSNGEIYADLDSLAAFAPDASMMQGWVGVELQPLLDEAAKGANTQLGSQDAMEISMALGYVNTGASGPFLVSLGAADPTGQYLQFVNTTRLANETVDGIEMAVFSSTFDYQTFFQSPVFRQLLKQIMEQEGAAVSDAELDQIAGMAQMFGPIVMTTLNLEVREWIGVEDNYLYNTNAVFKWDLSSIAALAAFGGDAMPIPQLPPDAKPYIGFEMTTSSSDLNGKVAVEVPEGAELIPTEMILQSAGQ
ncbi:MAG: hypothetical protein R2911_45215 [Caldilineaceae bacterium]